MKQTMPRSVQTIAIAVLPLAVLAAAERPTVVATQVEALRERIASTKTEDEGWARLGPQLDERLQQIAREAEAGRELLALHRLAEAHNTLQAYLFRLDQDPQAFEAMRVRERERLSAGPKVEPDLPAAYRAMAEAARARMLPYVSASGPYAAASSPENGLFYLGRARAFGEFVELCNRAGSGVAAAQPPALHGLGSELDALEQQVLEAYRPPLSIDRHSDFIELHASLKLARELEDAGARFGALYQYVEATVRLSQIVPPTEAPVREALERAARQFDARFGDGAVDHGIGRLFLEMAQSALAGDGESETAEPGLAAAVLTQGLPAYFEAIGAAAKRGPAVQPEVTVTLVRWPYT